MWSGLLAPLWVYLFPSSSPPGSPKMFFLTSLSHPFISIILIIMRKILQISVFYAGKEAFFRNKTLFDLFLAL